MLRTGSKIQSNRIKNDQADPSDEIHYLRENTSIVFRDCQFEAYMTNFINVKNTKGFSIIGGYDHGGFDISTDQLYKIDPSVKEVFFNIVNTKDDKYSIGQIGTSNPIIQNLTTTNGISWMGDAYLRVDEINGQEFIYHNTYLNNETYVTQTSRGREVKAMNNKSLYASLNLTKNRGLRLHKIKLYLHNDYKTIKSTSSIMIRLYSDRIHLTVEP